MGLDMYMTRKSYVKNWEHTKPEDRHTITVKRGGELRKDIDSKRIEYVIEDMGSWRKANHIHNWFVANVQDGEDDCKDYYVSREQLAELRDICKKVLEASELVEGKINNGKRLTDKGWEPILEDGKYIKDSRVAHELLPTTDGFFFGSTDYDEYYLQDVKSTIGILEECLALEDGDFYYSSSW